MKDLTDLIELCLAETLYLVFIIVREIISVSGYLKEKINSMILGTNIRAFT